MDRSRRAPNRRQPFGSSSSPHSTSEMSQDRQSPASPVMAHAAQTPQSAPQGRRASRPLQHAFTFSTPDPAGRNLNLRKRSRTADNFDIPDDEVDEHGAKKGGHSLRKRARVDYTFEHIDDAPVVPSSTSAARRGKRKPDMPDEPEDFFAAGGSKGRGASLGADTPSSRRKTPARKPADAQSYRDEFDDDENDVQDTIEVGGSYSDVEASDFHETSHSSISTPDKGKLPLNSSPPVIQHLSGTWRNSPEPLINEPAVVPAVDPELQTSTYVRKDDVVSQEVPPEQESVESKPEKQASPALPNSPPASHRAEVDFMAPTEDPPNEDASQEAQVEEPRPLPQDVKRDSPVAIKAEMIGDGDGRIAANVPQAPLQPLVVEAVSQSADASEKSPASPTAHELKTALPGEVVSEAVTAEKPLQENVSEATDRVAADVPRGDEDPGASGQGSSHEDQTIPEPVPESTTDVHMADVEVAPTDLQSQPLQEREEPAVQAPEPRVTLETPEAIPPSRLATPSIDITEPPKSEPVAAESASASAEKVSPAPSETEPKSLLEAAPIARSEPAPSTPKPPQTDPRFFRPQPTPAGKWAFLTPYVNGEFETYPEKKVRSDDEGATEDQTPEEKDTDKEANDMEPMVEDNDDAPDPVVIEVPTPAIATPLRGSPVPESADPTTFNSPAPAGEEPDEADMSDSQEPPETRRYFKYRKLRNTEDYINAIENYEELSTTDLYDMLGAINVSLLQWQNEWTDLGKVVDDHENSLRRRVADSKYESRTRNLHQHGVNYEEPDFGVKGYKAREKEMMSETRYLQGQDRIMAATYGFEYDPHPSKIGRQNPETQQVGIMTRGRSLRNQPRQTTKASEADEVTGKRQRKPVQLFDPAMQDYSRSSTPVPGRGRRRRNANIDAEDNQLNVLSSSFNGEAASDMEEVTPRRRKRGPRPKIASTMDMSESFPPMHDQGYPNQEEISRSGRRGRAKHSSRYDDSFGYDDRSFPSEGKQRKRHLLTLKIPQSKNFSETGSAISDNGDSRPSSASSDSTTHTAESSYSFRPKRQKRFRDDPDDSEEFTQGPPKKRGKRLTLYPTGGIEMGPVGEYVSADAAQKIPNRKVQKIKVVRPNQASRNGTPSSLPATEDGDEPQKDYKSMTKSEKMSASMKSRWANGNMAGAVEKRKATLAAKKAAQAAAEQKVGLIAPKPKTKPAKKDTPQPTPEPHGFVPGIPGVGFPFPST